MGERVSSVPLTAIKAIRVTCQKAQSGGRKCGFVLEIPLDAIAKRHPPHYGSPPLSCPVCGNSFVYSYKDPMQQPSRAPVDKDPCPDLDVLLKGIDANKQMTVEFVFPAEPVEIVLSSKQ
jgi:hypothetical protein